MFLNIAKSIIKNKLGVLQRPSFVTFFVTWRCNARCIMCDVWQKRQGESELSLKEIKDVFGQIKKIDAIRISGGEPFLRQDIADIINIIEKTSAPSVYHITTNGFLTEKIISDIKKIKPIKKVHIKISIDSVGERHDNVRGIKGAYDMAMKTVSELSKLRENYGFYLGVNQTIIDKESMESYFKLAEELKKFKVSVHPVFAYTNTTALYSGNNIKTNPKFKPFGNFKKEELFRFIKKLTRDAGLFSDTKESIIKKYYLKGILNRVVFEKESPNPKCTALKSHLRILPNGDIPICLYNSNVAGNLKKDKFENIWFGENIKKHREWVKKCPGCWTGCESVVSAIYTGDIVRGTL